MTITPLTEAHLDILEAIEASDGDAHWSRVQFEKELEGEFVRFFVLQADDASPVAYGGYWKAGPEAQITNLVVRRDQRCIGYAKRLLEFLFDCARGEECTVMTLEVRAANAHAIALYAKMGFTETGRREKLYTDPVDDAVLMEKKL